MPTSPQTALQRLLDRRGEVAEICRARGIGLLVAFGSVVRDEPEPGDLDLAFMAQARGQADVLGLLGDLVDLTGTDRLDLLDLDRAGVVAAHRALGAGLPLLESAPSFFAEAQIRAATMFADTRWLRDLQLAHLAAG